MVKDVAESKNENAVEDCATRTSSCHPAESEGLPHLGFSAWLRVVVECPKSQSNFFAGKSHPNFQRGKELLLQWQSTGYPSLGEWPPDGVESFDYSLGALGAVCQ